MNRLACISIISIALLAPLAVQASRTGDTDCLNQYKCSTVNVTYNRETKTLYCSVTPSNINPEGNIAWSTVPQKPVHPNCGLDTLLNNDTGAELESLCGQVEVACIFK